MAHINKPRVRETSVTLGTADFELDGAMNGSLAFADVMSAGDTCDYCASYANSFEEGLGTLGVDGKLQRTTVYQSLHADGTIDDTKVAFTTAPKTVILTYASPRVADLITLALKVARGDQAVSLSSDEKAQVRANAPPFAAGIPILFRQTSAPVGWTKDTTHNDKSLRIVSGTVGSGGSVDFSTCFSRTATDAFTLAQTNLPAVAFVNQNIAASSSQPSIAVNSTGVEADFPTAFLNIPAAGGTGVPDIISIPAITITNQGTAASGGSGTSKQAGMDIRVKYVDAIIASCDG